MTAGDSGRPGEGPPLWPKNSCAAGLPLPAALTLTEWRGDEPRGNYDNVRDDETRETVIADIPSHVNRPAAPPARDGAACDAP
jgi:hypothetical protein